MTHVLLAGGAQAVAAMAWGTETCPKVTATLGGLAEPAAGAFEQYASSYVMYHLAGKGPRSSWCVVLWQVDKILGPGNQYVTAAKMLLQNSEAMVSMDMPAGPSEVTMRVQNPLPNLARSKDSCWTCARPEIATGHGHCLRALAGSGHCRRERGASIHSRRPAVTSGARPRQPGALPEIHLALLYGNPQYSCPTSRSYCITSHMRLCFKRLHC